MTRQFRNRFVWVSISAVFVLLYLFLMARDKRAIEQEMFREIEWHAVSTLELLQREVEEHLPLEEVLGRLDDPRHFDRFDKQVRTKIGHLGLLRINFYNAAGDVVYSDNPELEGESFPDGDGFQTAKAGHTAVRHIDREDYEGEYGGDPPAVDMAEVYIPVMPDEGRIPRYIFESYRDFSPYRDRAHRLGSDSAASLFVVVAVALFLTLLAFTVARRLDRKVQLLEQLVPMCSSCKKLRLERPGKAAVWVAVETYFGRKHEVEFTHGICPDCARDLYGWHVKGKSN